MSTDDVRTERLADGNTAEMDFDPCCPAPSAPGEASGRIGLALVAVGLVVLFSLLNASFFRLDNFVAIGVNSTSILIAVLGTSALADRRLCRSLHRQHGGAYRHHHRQGRRGDAGRAARRRRRAWALGFLLGLINGMLVRKLSISPLIVTLAMLALYGGLAFVVSSIAVYGFPDALLELGRGKIVGIQYTVLIAVGIFIVGSFILTQHVTGLRIYAIGGDPRAAELCGVPVGRTVVGLYAVNGFLIGLVAVLIAGRLGSITPTIGVRFELDVLTAAILGGVAFSGGAGRPLGIAIGVATIGILNAGLIFVGLQSWWQSIAVGGMLLLALVADQAAIGLRAPTRPPAAINELHSGTKPAGCRPPCRRRSAVSGGAASHAASGLLDRRGAEILRRADRTGGSGPSPSAKARSSASSATTAPASDAGEDHLRRHPARCRLDDARGTADCTSGARRTHAPPASRRSTRTLRSARTSASPTT